MADVLFTFVLGAVSILAGWLTLRAKSLILPGYRQFGMSDDANLAVQKIAGWLAVGWGAVILVFGVINLIGTVLS